MEEPPSEPIQLEVDEAQRQKNDDMEVDGEDL